MSGEIAAQRAVGEILTFGPFTLLPRRRELRRGEETVPLGSRALDILTLLAERAGDVVSRNEIFARVWPDLHVEEGNLRVHIAGLRKALGEAGSTARYIATVPNRGYSLVVPVEARPDAAPPTNIAVSNLPRRLTTVIGREHCVAMVVSDVGIHRFVTIVGPGGIGKSTVAVAVANRLAEHFADGVGFADFSGVASGNLAAASLASALGVTTGFSDPLDALLAFLRERRMLVVLDCCELVVEAAAILAEAILKEAPFVCILATSREPLRGDGERLFRLPPLGLPVPGTAPTMDEALGYSAIRLFVERAGAADDAFAAMEANVGLITDICLRLDGIPLAIELAAARVPQMALQELHDRLDGRFSLLIRGRRTALPRHQTLRATLDWSFGTLPVDEQRLAMRLAIFRGDFTVDAAEAVASYDGAEDSGTVVEGIARLVDKSLISVERDDASAYYRLLDVTRAYLMEKLANSGHLNAISAAHARHFATSLAAALGGSPVPTSDEIRRGCGRFLDNVRAALAWAFGPDGSADIGITLTLATVPLWSALMLVEEMRIRLQQAIDVAESFPDVAPALRMRLHGGLGTLATHTAASVEAIKKYWGRTLEFAESSGDRVYQLRSLSGLMLAATRRDYRAGLQWAERYRALAAQSNDPRDGAVGDRLVGWVLHNMGEHNTALPLVEGALEQMTAMPDRDQPTRRNFDERVLAMGMLARLLFVTGWPQKGLEMANEAVREARAIDHIPSLMFAVLFCAGQIALLSGDLDLIDGGRDGLVHELRRHSTWNGWSRAFVAIDRMQHGEVGLAAELRASLAVMPPDSFGVQFPLFHAAMAKAQLAAGDNASALATVDAALARVRAQAEFWFEPELLRVRARVLLARGAAGDAAEALQASLSQARAQGAVCWELRTAIDLAGLTDAAGTGSTPVDEALVKLRDGNAARYLDDRRW